MNATSFRSSWQQLLSNFTLNASSIYSPTFSSYYNMPRFSFVFFFFFFQSKSKRESSPSLFLSLCHRSSPGLRATLIFLSVSRAFHPVCRATLCLVPYLFEQSPSGRLPRPFSPPLLWKLFLVALRLFLLLRSFIPSYQYWQKQL